MESSSLRSSDGFKLRFKVSPIYSLILLLHLDLCLSLSYLMLYTRLTRKICLLNNAY